MIWRVIVGGLLLCLIASAAQAQIVRHSIGNVAQGASATTGLGIMPAGAVVGDELVANVCIVQDNVGTFTCPTGWTAVTAAGYNTGNALRDNACVIPYSAGANLTFSWSEASAWQMRIVAYSGVNTTTPIDGAGINTDNNAVAKTNLASGTLTPTQSGDALLVNWCAYNAGAGSTGGGTIPPGLTNNYDDVNGAQAPGQFGSYQILASAATTTQYTYNLNQSGGAQAHLMGSLAFLLAPANAVVLGSPGHGFIALSGMYAGPVGASSLPNIIYVSSSTGNDSNSGATPSTAWATINKVRASESSLTPGTKVCMRGGDTWQSTGTSGTTSAQLNLSGVVGALGNPIVFTTCAGFGMGRWIIDANNTTQYCVDAIGTTVSYVTIDQLECKGAINSGILFSFSNETSSTPGMPGITISNNLVHNTGDGCSTPSTGVCKAGIDGPSYAVDAQIEFYNNSSCSPSCAGDSVQILNNIVHDVGGHNTIRVHGDYGAFQIAGNTVGPGCVHNCIDVKMAGSAGHIATIHNNIVDVGTSLGYNDTTALYTENDDNPDSYIEYYENVAYDNTLMLQVCNSNAALLSGSGLTCASTCNIHVYAYNNTDYAYFNSTGQYAVYGPWCASGENGTGYMDVRNNIFDGSGFNYTSADAPSNSVLLGEDYNDCGGIQTKPTWFTNQCSGSNEKSNVDPKYVSASAAVFDLLTTSTLLNAGVSPVLVTGNPNIGAYAGSGESVTITPASPFAFTTTSIGNSTPQTFTLTNNTVIPITISSQPSLSPTTGYAVSGNTCPVSPATLAAGASCTFVVTFTPTSATTFNSTLSETDNGP